MVLFGESNIQMSKTQERERQMMWRNLNDSCPAKRGSKHVPLTFRAVRLHHSLITSICCNYNAVHQKNTKGMGSSNFDEKYKKNYAQSTILDESSKIPRVNLLKQFTGNLKEEFLSQTEGLLSKVIEIEAIVKELENLKSEKEKCAFAALLSTDYSFKIADIPVEKITISSAEYDIDNISFRGVINKKFVLQAAFNNTFDVSLQLSSLELDNTDKVSQFLSYYMRITQEGLDKYQENCFSDLISNRCKITPVDIRTVSKKMTHFKNKKKLESIAICTNNIFGTNPMNWVLSYDTTSGKIVLMNRFYDKNVT
jgi:hypothetical protein